MDCGAAVKCWRISTLAWVSSLAHTNIQSNLFHSANCRTVLLFSTCWLRFFAGLKRRLIYFVHQLAPLFFWICLEAYMQEYDSHLHFNDDNVDYDMYIDDNVHSTIMYAYVHSDICLKKWQSQWRFDNQILTSLWVPWCWSRKQSYLTSEKMMTVIFWVHMTVTASQVGGDMTSDKWL